MYKYLIKPFLFALHIERAHQIVMLLLRLIGCIPGGRWILDKCYAVHHPSLEKEVFGVHFRNPIGIAAGFDRNGDVYREMAAMGFGFVEVGTITPQPQSGNPRPRLFRLKKDESIINRLGFPNRGLKTAIHNLRHPHHGVIVGCNIGKNISTEPENAAADYLKSFRNLYQYADYFTVNMCCGNDCLDATSNSSEYIMQILEPLFDFRRGQNQYRPIMLKISPDLTDEEIDQITDVLVSSPLDGIVATTGTHLRDGLATSESTMQKIGAGRLSGRPLTKRTIEIVRRIHTRSGGMYPIIGVGGMMTADDVEQMMQAGADLVQLYSGYIYHGPDLVKEVCNRLVEKAEQELLEREKAEVEMKANADVEEAMKTVEEKTREAEQAEKLAQEAAEQAAKAEQAAQEALRQAEAAKQAVAEAEKIVDEKAKVAGEEMVNPS